MADSLATNFANRFNEQFDMLAQSMLPKLEPAVIADTEGGEKAFRDQIGEMDGEEVAGLNDDTPIQAENSNRRAITTTPWVWNRLVRRWEVTRLMKDPQNAYVRAAVAARNRHVNKKIAAAAIATAKGGKDGSNDIPFDTANQAVSNSGNTGLTLAKIREAHKILGNNAVLDIEMGDLYFTASYTQQADLLATTEATSSDFSAVKALVNGEIDFFMGFRWIWLQDELIGKTGNDRQCFAHAKSGLTLRKPEDMFRRITERPDKNYNMQVYMSGDYGAARLEEKKVVLVPCTEAA